MAGAGARENLGKLRNNGASNRSTLMMIDSVTPQIFVVGKSPKSK
jgi:hypothetical protein